MRQGGMSRRSYLSAGQLGALLVLVLATWARHQLW